MNSHLNSEQFEVIALNKKYTVYAYDTAIGIEYDCHGEFFEKVKLIVTDDCANPPQFSENGVLVTERSIAIGEAIQNHYE